MKEDLTIKIPSFYFDDIKSNDSLKFFMDRLSDCLIDYKQEFGIEPNEIKFCGKRCSVLYSMFNNMLSSVYTCSQKSYGKECFVFSNKDTKTQKQTKQGGIKNESSFSGKMVEGFCAPDISNFLSFSYDIEKEVETQKEYLIEIL